MHRLPGFDPVTRRSEKMVYCSLALVAISGLAVGLVSAARFAVEREAIIAALTAEPITVAAQPGQKTNVASIRSQPAKAAVQDIVPVRSIQSM